MTRQVASLPLGDEACRPRAEMVAAVLRAEGVRDVFVVCASLSVEGRVYRHAVVVYDGVVYDPGCDRVMPWGEFEFRGWRVVECSR